ncbi:MAG TPA: hypothetical protein VLH56_15675 [Dissulfurispiraceae bacterium]|nr:hypothetical protein [Dissulfurispiraceae bacterium]
MAISNGLCSGVVELGIIRTIKIENLMLIDALSGFLHYSAEAWEKATREIVSQEFADGAMNAFHAGSEGSARGGQLHE